MASGDLDYHANKIEASVLICFHFKIGQNIIQYITVSNNRQ